MARLDFTILTPAFISYDPTVRRFLNADSLFIAGDEVTGANMYAYCNGNPVMLWDPSGMASESWGDELRDLLARIAAYDRLDYLLGLIKDIASVGITCVKLMNIIYGEEHGENDWRAGQYAIASIIWNIKTDTTLNDFKNMYPSKG